MFCSILVSLLLALCTHMLLHCRIDDEFFTDRVSSQFPNKLILPADLGVVVLCTEDVVVVFLELGVVMLDGVHHSRFVCGRHRSGTSVGSVGKRAVLVLRL